MTREQIEARMGTLKDELTKANEELGTLRPRVQFLEQAMLRIDGALTVLHELLETPSVIPPGVHDRDHLYGPVAPEDRDKHPFWQPVAP